MADPYRTACEQPSWTVTLRRQMFPSGPYRFYLSTTLVMARDSVEAVQKAAETFGFTHPDYEVIEVEMLEGRTVPLVEPVPSPSPGEKP